MPIIEEAKKHGLFYIGKEWNSRYMVSASFLVYVFPQIEIRPSFFVPLSDTASRIEKIENLTGLPDLLSASKIEIYQVFLSGNIAKTLEMKNDFLDFKATNWLLLLTHGNHFAGK